MDTAIGLVLILLGGLAVWTAVCVLSSLVVALVPVVLPIVLVAGFCALFSGMGG